MERVVVSHEAYHYIKENNAEGARKIQDVVVAALKRQGVNIEDRLTHYDKQGYKRPEQQMDELVADSMFDVFNRETIDELIRSGGRELTEALADKIGKTITQLERSLRNLEIKSYDAGEIAKLRNDVEALKKIRDLFFEALEDVKEGKTAETAEKNKNTRTGDGGVKYSFGVTQDDINEYVRKAKTKENHADYKKYANVSDRLLQELSPDIDLTGYVHALRDNDIRHIFNSHGEYTNEKYPVTEKDVANIPYIVENYDKVYFRKHKGHNSVLYIKVSSDGTTYYVEQATDKYGDVDLLVNKQMIKTGENDIPSIYLDTIKEKEGIAKFLADLNTIRKEYAQSVVSNPSNGIVYDRGKNVNNNFSRMDSDADAEYMELAKEPEKNKAKLQNMVEQAAKAAGYSQRM